MARTGKNLKVVHRRQGLVVQEDGSSTLSPVALYLDSTGDQPSFVYLLPGFVQTALGVPEQVAAPTGAQAMRDRDKLLRDYIEHAKNANPEPGIIVSYGYTGEALDGKVINTDHTQYYGREDAEARRSISLEYRLVFLVNGKVYGRQASYPHVTHKMVGGSDFTTDDRTQPPIYKPGRLETHTDVSTVMPYTPELHAKLDRLVAAIDQAAQVLHELNKAKDRAAALLAIGATPLLPAPPTRNTTEKP